MLFYKENATINLGSPVKNCLIESVRRELILSGCDTCLKPSKVGNLGTYINSWFPSLTTMLDQLFQFKIFPNQSLGKDTEPLLLKTESYPNIFLIIQHLQYLFRPIILLHVR